MTAYNCWFIRCQGSRCSKESNIADTRKEAFEEAKEMGFVRVKVENGSYWDFCHECHIKYIVERHNNITER